MVRPYSQKRDKACTGTVCSHIIELAEPVHTVLPTAHGGLESSSRTLSEFAICWHTTLHLYGAIGEKQLHPPLIRYLGMFCKLSGSPEHEMDIQSS